MNERVDGNFEYRRFRRLGTRADAWALSSEAAVAKDIFAAIASDGRSSFSDLRESVLAGSLKGWDADWVSRIARVLALQPHESALHDFAFEALKLSVPALPRTEATLAVRKILFEILVKNGDIDAARELLSRDPELSILYHGYLHTDLMNPFAFGDWGDFDQWLEGFNAPFAVHGLSWITVDPNAPYPFDSLGSTVEARSVEGPLVTVIITTFNPDQAEIRTSVRSVLQQTWVNLEVLLIDDHSDEATVSVLKQIASEDPRVRLIRQPVNGGTYRARNTGIRLATGQYVTGQDTDDWSHPERIARQVAALEADPGSPGVTAAANRTDDRLNRVALGNNPHRMCEVSLMLRVETAEKIGGYLPVRKAADSEFRERLEAWSGRSVTVLQEPLYVIRMSPSSLSRADFRPGWSHHARRAFWSAYKEWHARADRDELQIDASNPELAVPATAPGRIAGPEWPQGSSYDVCLVADWRSDSPEQRAGVDELHALLDTDLNVAILHSDTPWGGTTQTPRALLPEVQRLVSEGRVRRLFPDEAVQLTLVVVRDPATVDYARRFPSALKTGRVLMIGHSNPAGRHESARRYDPVRAHAMAREIFGRDPQWMVPRGQDWAAFRAHYAVPTLSNPYPLVLDAPRYAGPRLRRPGDRLVVGRAAENDTLEWPDKDTLLGPYPIDGSIELRVLGDARGAARVLRDRHLPVDWLQFRNGEIAPEVFWRTIDAVAIYDGIENGRSLERPVLEALVAGVPVVSDAARAEHYDGAVLSAPADEALNRIRRLLADPQRLEEHCAMGREFAEGLAPPDGLRDLIYRLLAETRAGSE